MSASTSVAIDDDFAAGMLAGVAGRTDTSIGSSSDEANFEVFSSAETFDSILGGFGGGRCCVLRSNGGGTAFVGNVEGTPDVGGGGGGGIPCFDREGGAGGGGGGCFVFTVDFFGAGGRGGGGGGVLGKDEIDFLLTELSETQVLPKLSIVLSSESLRGRFIGNDGGVVCTSDSSRFGDFLEGELNTKLASPSSTESKLSWGGDVDPSKVDDPKSPLFAIDGDCDKYFSGTNESARFSLYGLPKFTINFDRTRACAESANSPVLGSKNASGMASSSTDQVGDPSIMRKKHNRYSESGRKERKCLMTAITHL